MNLYYHLKHTLKLGRWQARRVACAWRWRPASQSSLPAVLGNAMPKSGSHLIIQVLLGLPDFAPFVNPGFPPVNRYEDNSRLPEEKMLANITRMQPGDLVSLRGPAGNSFPVEENYGRDALFVAGGIASGLLMVHYLMMGASGVQLGTRFVCASECIAHPAFKQAFIRGSARETSSTSRVPAPSGCDAGRRKLRLTAWPSAVLVAALAVHRLPAVAPAGVSVALIGLGLALLVVGRHEGRAALRFLALLVATAGWTMLRADLAGTGIAVTLVAPGKVASPYFELIRHDVIHPLFVEVDEIFHLACPASPIHYQENPIKTVKTNVMGTINMLGLAKRIRARILLASTSEVYGDAQVHPQTESYWGNVNPIGIRSCYDEGKRCAETLFFDYRRQHGLRIKVARIFNTYGPRMHPNDGRVVSNFIVQALQNKPITVYGDGSQSRSFCYVDDLIDEFPDRRVVAGALDSVASLAAEAGVAIVVHELAGIGDWNLALAGLVHSAVLEQGDTVVDLPDGSSAGLAELTARANCGRPGACSESDRTAFTAARPDWSSNCTNAVAVSRGENA